MNKHGAKKHFNNIAPIMASNTSNTDTIVTIPYDDLHSDKESVLKKIGQGFGVDGYGIIAITNIPNYTGLRSRLLHLGRQLATETPKEILDKLTIPESYYSVGWSHGKEKVEGDKFDTGKGSFYANPITDDVLNDVLQRDFDSQDEQGQDHDQGRQLSIEKEEFIRVAKANPAFYHPNVWPDEMLPELKHTLKEMGMLIRNIGKLVGRRCDAYVSSQCDGYAAHKLENIINSSLCAKARLLHYFPSPSDGDDEEDPKVISDKGTDENTEDDIDYSTWCGWHNDHCSMTGLVPAMYVDTNGQEIACPDPDAGLYIKSRKGELIHVNVPHDALAFQIGETAQIHTGGVLQATPHAVRGCNPNNSACKGISRESFAVFMEPE